MIGTIAGVSKKRIEAAERATGIAFPEALKRYWINVGHGHFLNGLENENRLFSPEEIVAFRRRKGEFRRVKPLNGEEHRLCFFRENEENHYSIDMSNGHVYVGNQKVADSLGEFVLWIASPIGGDG